MRKFYSLVLMAAALLIGTNVKAGNFTFTLGGVAQDVTSMSLYDAFTTILNTQNAEAVITLTAPESLEGTPSRLKFNSKQNITFDLAGHNLVDGIRIDVIDAKLRVINNGSTASIIDASNCNGNGSQAFNTYGVSETDNTVARDACYFLLGENITLNVKSYGVAVMYYGAFAGTSVNGRPTYGTTVDIRGEIVASEGTGIATNGTMSFATGDKTKCPIINIYSSAVITGSNDLDVIEGKANGNGEEKAVYAKVGAQNYKTTSAAVYGPGYAEWNIAGTLNGGVGLYLKSGIYNINNATVHATAAEYWEPIAYGNGFIGAGSAIIFDSHVAYGGQIEMTIDGANTEVSSNAGYAIQDVKTTQTGSEAETAVENIEIKNGSFESNAGDVITTTDALKEQIIANGSITGGTYSDESIATYIEAIAGDVVPDGQGHYVVKVSVDVTLNGDGLATFSAKKNVIIPTGLAAYKATSLQNDELNLVIVEDNVIPANTGVILYKENGAGSVFTLNETDDNSSFSFADNLLLPSSAWTADKAGAAYILHGSELWIYTGEEFKANKAFMSINAGNAPQRIRMVFHAAEEAQGVENVEVEAAKAEKFYENGQLFIRRGAEVYNVQGQLVK